MMNVLSDVILKKSFGLTLMIITVFGAAISVSTASAQQSFGGTTESQWGLAIIGGIFEPSQSKDSYSEVYDGYGPLAGFAGYWTSPIGIGIEASGEYFAKSGDRAYISGDTVDNGSEDLSILSLLVTGRYFFIIDKSFSPYAGLGIGSYSLNIDTPGPLENVSGTGFGYHIVGGIDLMRFSTVGVGFWARYSSVPDVIGNSAFSAYYDEDDIGGLSFGAKLLINF